MVIPFNPILDPDTNPDHHQKSNCFQVVLSLTFHENFSQIRLWLIVWFRLANQQRDKRQLSHNLISGAGVVENSSHRKIIPTRSSTG